MSDRLQELEDQVTLIFRTGIESFKAEVKDEAADFLKAKASQAAKQLLKAETTTDPAIKAEALSNMAHIKAQVNGELAALQLVATKRAGELLEKVITVALEALKTRIGL